MHTIGTMVESAVVAQGELFLECEAMTNVPDDASPTDEQAKKLQPQDVSHIKIRLEEWLVSSNKQMLSDAKDTFDGWCLNRKDHLVTEISSAVTHKVRAELDGTQERIERELLDSTKENAKKWLQRSLWIITILGVLGLLAAPQLLILWRIDPSLASINQRIGELRNQADEASKTALTAERKAQEVIDTVDVLRGELGGARRQVNNMETQAQGLVNTHVRYFQKRKYAVYLPKPGSGGFQEPQDAAGVLAKALLNEGYDVAFRPATLGDSEFQGIRVEYTGDAEEITFDMERDIKNALPVASKVHFVRMLEEEEARLSRPGVIRLSFGNDVLDWRPDDRTPGDGK